MRRSGKSYFALAFAALLPLTVIQSTGCDDDSDPVDPGTASLRVIHLSPDAPAVDVWVNGSIKAVEDLAFGEGTSYLEVDAGIYDFEVSPTGGTVGDSVLGVEGAGLADGKSYTVAAFDELAGIQALLIEDDFSALDAGNIRLRAIHAAAAVGEVDIWLLPTSGTPSALYENVAFGDVGEYLDVPAAALTLGFDANNDGTPDLIFDVPALSAGTVANVFAVSNDDGDVYLLAQLQDGTIARIDPRAEVGEARIRVIHLSPDAPAVDIYAGMDTKAVSELAFGEGTDYLTLDEGTYSFYVTTVGGSPSSPVLSISDVSLEDGKSYTAVAFDELGSIQALALEDDYSTLDASKIRVRAIHAAVDVGQVDIWLLGTTPAPLYQDVDFGVAGGTLDVPAEAFSIGFDVDNDQSPDVTFDIPALPAGTVVNVFAVNDADGNLFLLAQLPDGSLAQIDPS